MSKTSAERQSAYRLRRNDEGDHRRINTWIRRGAHRALVRLSKHYNISQAEVVEKLLFNADEEVKKELIDDCSKIDAYMMV